MLFLGIDLAWRSGTGTRSANETGVVALQPSGVISEADWTRGLDATIVWINRVATAHDVLMFVDAPLVVDNRDGQRLCETQVGQCYGKWKVSANSTNLRSLGLQGVALRERLEEQGWAYHDGRTGPPTSGRYLAETYPYATLVGASELGYEKERPPYKRAPRGMSTAIFAPHRAATCDALIARLAKLEDADPPLRLGNHPTTAELIRSPSPLKNREYKHREDLIDATICAWTAALWHRHGLERSQVLGPSRHETTGLAATIIVACRDSQKATHRRYAVPKDDKASHNRWTDVDGQPAGGTGQ